MTEPSTKWPTNLPANGGAWQPRPSPLREFRWWLMALLPLAGVLGAGMWYAAATDIVFPEIEQRLVYRTFFFHVPTAISANLLLVALLVVSVLYLWTKREIFDRLNLALTEIALVSYSFVLASGMLWAKSAWGQYWNWEPRLTSSAVLWFLVVSALVLRSAIDDPGRRMRLAAVFGIIIFVDVPLVHFATAWFAEGLHPARATATMGEGYQAVRPVLILCGVGIFSLLAVLVALRTRIEGIRRQAAELARRAAADHS